MHSQEAVVQTKRVNLDLDRHPVMLRYMAALMSHGDIIDIDITQLKVT